MNLAPLPIDAVLPDLTSALSEAGAAVLVAPPGAGKTTRVPSALLEAGFAGDGQIVMLEPRRMAARAAARRIAEERGVPLGDEVGFRIRFERKQSARTRILVVTEGILVALLQRDPFLEGIAALVFDEFHERNLDSDLALAMARRLREEARPDLTLVAMSATIDPTPLSQFLGTRDRPAPIIESPGRMHPVTVRHRAPSRGARLEQTVADAVAETLATTPGDLLVFLPGVGEIRDAERALSPLADRHDLEVLPLHGELPPESQDRALRRGEKRRVICATNVAESSVTVEGVTAVIDSGLARVPRFDLSVGLNRLERGPISIASADQRAGRAGRVAPGTCVRLWSAMDERAMPATEAPEIARVDLSGPALQLLAWGESDLAAFPWFEAPDPAALGRAIHLLVRLGAVSESTVSESAVLEAAVSQVRITPLGKRLARLPLAPRLGRIAVSVAEFGHAKRLALVAALLSERDPLLRPRFDPRDPRSAPVTDRTDCDVLTRVVALERFRSRGRGGDRSEERGGGGPRDEKLHRGAAHRIAQAARQIASILTAEFPDPPRQSVSADEAVSRALLAAFPDRLARRRDRPSGTEDDRRGVMVGGRGVRLRPESGLTDAELFLCIDLDAGRRGERAEAGVRQASRVDEEWLDPTLLREELTLEFDEARGQVVRVKRVLFDDLTVRESRALAEASEEVSERLAVAAAEQLTRALPLDDPELAGLRARVRWLSEHRPELAFPLLDDPSFRELLPALCAGKRSFRELQKAPLLDFVRSMLSPEQANALTREAPESIEVPSGSRLSLAYEPGKAPVLAVRIQEVFGWQETPRLAGGRVPILLHLLAPNHRPQQVTDDLRSFWENTYPVVRKELRRRYPKHAWPEDPWSAKAERRPGRKRK